MDGPAGIYVVADLAGAPSGAIAPLIGAWMVDLFAARHFALTLEWSSPIHQLSVHVLSIRGLDFVFLISALAELFAFQWLALIQEPGRVGNILWEFKEVAERTHRVDPAILSSLG